MIEDTSTKPQVGDYVICEEKSYTTDLTVVSFIKSNIGQLIEINSDKEVDYPYVVKYENVTDEIYAYFGGGSDNIYDKCRGMSETEIKYWAKNKKELEHILRAKKYNL